MSYESDNLRIATERFLDSNSASAENMQSRIARLETRVIELELFKLNAEPYIKAMKLIEPDPANQQNKEGA
jgi:hypothetical protein